MSTWSEQIESEREELLLNVTQKKLFFAKPVKMMF